jgi:hypothetical protein
MLGLLSPARFKYNNGEIQATPNTPIVPVRVVGETGVSVGTKGGYNIVYTRDKDKIVCVDKPTDVFLVGMAVILMFPNSPPFVCVVVVSLGRTIPRTRPSGKASSLFYLVV